MNVYLDEMLRVGLLIIEFLAILWLLGKNENRILDWLNRLAKRLEDVRDAARGKEG